MKDHEIVILVNDLRDIALRYVKTQALHELPHNRLIPEIRHLSEQIENLQAMMANLAEHNDLAQHEGCTCRLCNALLDRDEAKRK